MKAKEQQDKQYAEEAAQNKASKGKVSPTISFFATLMFAFASRAKPKPKCQTTNPTIP